MKTIVFIIVGVALIAYIVALYLLFHYMIHCGDKYWEERWRKEKKHGRTDL